MFGYGMVFAGGCASRNLARVGGGDLRALLTLIVLGLFAYMAIGGILGPIRSWLEQSTSITLPTPTQSVGALIDRGLALSAGTGRHRRERRDRRSPRSSIASRMRNSDRRRFMSGPASASVCASSPAGR